MHNTTGPTRQLPATLVVREGLELSWRLCPETGCVQFRREWFFAPKWVYLTGDIDLINASELRDIDYKQNTALREYIMNGRLLHDGYLTSDGHQRLMLPGGTSFGISLDYGRAEIFKMLYTQAAAMVSGEILDSDV